MRRGGTGVPLGHLPAICAIAAATAQAAKPVGTGGGHGGRPMVRHKGAAAWRSGGGPRAGLVRTEPEREHGVAQIELSAEGDAVVGPASLVESDPNDFCKDVDGGGWDLVRHVPSQTKGIPQWHPAQDKLKGDFIRGCAGDPSGTNCRANDHDPWSRKFDHLGKDQFMFATGNCKFWLITPASEVTGLTAVGRRAQILKSSYYPRPYRVMWMLKKFSESGEESGPVISLTDANQAVYTGEVLYAEGEKQNGKYEDTEITKLLNRNLGANVYIRTTTTTTTTTTITTTITTSSTMGEDFQLKKNHLFKTLEYTWDSPNCQPQHRPNCLANSYRLVRSWPNNKVEGELAVRRRARVLKMNCMNDRSETQSRRRDKNQAEGLLRRKDKVCVKPGCEVIEDEQQAKECADMDYPTGCAGDPCFGNDQSKLRRHMKTLGDEDVRDVCDGLEGEKAIWRPNCFHMARVIATQDKIPKSVPGSNAPCVFWWIKEWECDAVSSCRLSSWGDWSQCTKTCEGGKRTRKRTVMRELNAVTKSNYPEKECNAARWEEQEMCAPEKCPSADCLWSEWTHWGRCSAPCGGGYKTRFRIKQEVEINGGLPCYGGESEWDLCATHACPMDCLYTAWSPWSACSASCETGTKTRTREIFRDASGDGAACQDKLKTQEQECRKELCPTKPPKPKKEW